MSYFDENKLPRINWRCSLNLIKFFKSPVRGYFEPNAEYVVTWYDKKLSSGNGEHRTFVEINLINLSTPTYKTQNGLCQSFIVIRVPINYLHKIPFGSIWKNGEFKEKFQCEEFEVKFSKDHNLSYLPLWKENHPFKCDKYVHTSDLDRFRKDGNNLLVIKHDNLSCIIHPLHFFMAHYGYSSELKRILSAYNWSEVTKRLCIKENPDNGNGRSIVLPRNLSDKDAVFLYHLKYDNYSKKVIEGVSNSIILSKEQNDSLDSSSINVRPKSNNNYRISCWHTQEITLSFYGIRLGNSVLCCQITGISQPQGEAITLALPPIVTKNKNAEKNANDEQQYRIIKKEREREHELEQLDIALNPVNNLVTMDVIEKLKLLGESRQINKIRITQEAIHSSNTKFLHYDEPSDFSVGDKTGKTGFTGIANCLYDIENDSKDGKSRLDTVWEHATRLRIEMEARVSWWTPKLGFREEHKFKLISLKDICDSANRSYPESTLILRIDAQGRTFFTFSFPERNNDTSFSSIVYEPANMSEFLSFDATTDGAFNFLKLLIEVVSLQGVSSDYVDSKNGRMAAFKHRTARNNDNNWVKNGIAKLL
ncbi:TPA: hypothetical protein QB387_001912 [Pasteurella multocida]|nr:hypothetical protein [Pasteurella multocida]